MSSFINELKSHGYRITAARRGIVEIFLHNSTPLTAKDVEKQLDKKNIKVNKTTVYREINFLIKREFIRELLLQSDSIHYEKTALGHHHHLICDVCGNIEDINLNNESKLFEEIMNQSRFEVQNHLLEFYGKCSNCS